MSDGLRLAGYVFEAMAFIVASCSPRTHEPMFPETVRQTGLNKYLFETASIRDQCSWVHMKQKGEATDKAKGLVRMAVANARLIKPLEEVGLPVTHKALVIGGGVVGIHILKGLGQLEKYEEIIGVKDWSTSRDGGPRKRVREDLRLQ